MLGIKSYLIISYYILNSQIIKINVLMKCFKKKQIKIIFHFKLVILVLLKEFKGKVIDTLSIVRSLRTPSTYDIGFLTFNIEKYYEFFQKMI